MNRCEDWQIIRIRVSLSLHFKDRRLPTERVLQKALEIAKQYQLDIVIPRQIFSWFVKFGLRELKIPVIHTYHTGMKTMCITFAKGHANSSGYR